MINDPFTMVVAIIAIITIGRIFNARHKSKHGIIEDKSGNHHFIGTGDSARMREEITALKDRIKVLERIATENASTSDINRQIEELRDR